MGRCVVLFLWVVIKVSTPCQASYDTTQQNVEMCGVIRSLGCYAVSASIARTGEGISLSQPAKERTPFPCSVFASMGKGKAIGFPVEFTWSHVVLGLWLETPGCAGTVVHTLVFLQLPGLEHMRRNENSRNLGLCGVILAPKLRDGLTLCRILCLSYIKHLAF